MNKLAQDHIKKFGEPKINNRGKEININERRKQYSVIYMDGYEYSFTKKVRISDDRNEIKIIK